MELNEKIEQLVESGKFEALSTSDKAFMGMMLENTYKEHAQTLAEGTVASDIANFTPILLPLVRRVYPTLIANEILGVQPMATPTGFIYSLVNRYIGNSEAIVGASKGQIVVLANLTGVDVGDTVTDGAGSTGTVAYVEANDVLDLTKGGKVLVNVPGAFLVAGGAIVAVYTNEAAFAQILKNYTGPMSTAAAEVLGTKMNEVGFEVARKSIEAKSQALKGRYSVEMYQDLKSQHGLAADEELMSLISYEMQAELDRNIVNFVNVNATQVPNAFNPSAADGRWEIEKYRTEVIKLKKESTQIGIDTKRGKGNIVIVSPNMATMMEEVGSFKTAEKASAVSQPLSGGVAGTFDNQFKVIVDQFSTTDYATVVYKGADRRDAMGFFAPYVPLSFTKVTNFETGQPAIIAKSRYALETIPGVETPISNDRAKKYARSFGVNFAGTALA